MNSELLGVLFIVGMVVNAFWLNKSMKHSFHEEDLKNN